MGNKLSTYTDEIYDIYDDLPASLHSQAARHGPACPSVAWSGVRTPEGERGGLRLPSPPSKLHTILDAGTLTLVVWRR